MCHNQDYVRKTFHVLHSHFTAANTDTLCLFWLAKNWTNRDMGGWEEGWVTAIVNFSAVSVLWIWALGKHEGHILIWKLGKRGFVKAVEDFLTDTIKAVFLTELHLTVVTEGQQCGIKLKGSVWFNLDCEWSLQKNRLLKNHFDMQIFLQKNLLESNTQKTKCSMVPSSVFIWNSAAISTMQSVKSRTGSWAEETVCSSSYHYSFVDLF